jgi:hypothetical protein
VGRVADLAVERDDVATPLHDDGQALAERLAGGNGVAPDLIGGQGHRWVGLEHMGRGVALWLGDVDVNVADIAELLDRRVGILQRLAVLALDVGGLARAVALDRAGDDHRRAVGGGDRLGERLIDGLDVVTVDLQRLPAGGLGAP